MTLSLTGKGAYHLAEGLVSDGVHVRRESAKVRVAILEHHVRPIEVRQALKGVDCDQDIASVGVDLIEFVARLQVPEHCGLVKVVELSHILHSHSQR